jgi:hypothetical protein
MGSILSDRDRFMMAHQSMLCAEISSAIASDKRKAFARGSEAAKHPSSPMPSFRDDPKDQTRNLEIPGSMLRIAPE